MIWHTTTVIRPGCQGGRRAVCQLALLCPLYMTPLHKHGVNNNRAVAAQSSPLVPPSTVCLQLPQASEHGGILGPLDSPLRCASATPPRKLTAVPPMSARHQWGMTARSSTVGPCPALQRAGLWSLATWSPCLFLRHGHYIPVSRGCPAQCRAPMQRRVSGTWEHGILAQTWSGDKEGLVVGTVRHGVSGASSKRTVA
jgi:hypothetical protein